MLDQLFLFLFFCFVNKMELHLNNGLPYTLEVELFIKAQTSKNCDQLIFRQFTVKIIETVATAYDSIIGKNRRTQHIFTSTN